MNPAFLDDMSWAMAEVYGAVTDRILVNIARHFKYANGPQDLRGSFDYQARKLAELGQVNRENMDIIVSSLEGADAALRTSLELAIGDALKTVEPTLREAAERGLLYGAGTTPPEVSPSQMQAFRAYYAQSADKLNLVNTVMLESSEDAYRATLSDAVNRIQRSQSILNASAGEVVTGVSSWNQAMRGAVDKMVENGLTGFIDHAGRRWSPEAYVAMDIRTTMFNTARAAVWERAEDYGSDIYQVSTHNGARPKCYPWQGKLISRIDNSRDVPDLDGNMVHVYAQLETSYGAADGLFGVNCKHYPTPFIPGFSTLRGEPQSAEENAKTYEESQQQRALERKVRDEKLKLSVLEAQGADEEAIKAQRDKVRAASADVQAFCDETGRTRRKSREYTPINATFPDKEEFNPSAAPRTTQQMIQEWAKGPRMDSQNVVSTAQATPAFAPAQTIDEAIRRAEKDGVKYARFEGMTLERANNALEAIETLPTDARPVAIANGKETAILTGRSLGRKADQWYGVTYDYRAFDLSVQALGYAPDYSGGIVVGLNTQKYKTLDALTTAKQATQKAYVNKTGHEWFFNTDGKATAFHEMGHCWADVRGLPDNWNWLAQQWAEESKCDMLKNPNEAFAEAWGAYHSGGRKLPEYIKTIIKGLK